MALPSAEQEQQVKWDLLLADFFFSHTPELRQ
jgi:hypothetical protein